MSETFYRIHWTGSPALSSANAWSALWGAERSEDGSQTRCGCEGDDPDCPTCDGSGWEDCQSGYSCCYSGSDLLAYFTGHGEPDAGEPVAIFEGERVGTGFDGEPLAIPTGHVRWTTYGALRAETE